MSFLSSVSQGIGLLFRMIGQWMYGTTAHHVLARLLYLPTVLRLMVREGPGNKWYNRLDDTVLLGALPFRSQTKTVGFYRPRPLNYNLCSWSRERM